MHAYIRTHIHMNIHTYIHTYLHTHIRTHINTCIQLCVLSVVVVICSPHVSPKSAEKCFYLQQAIDLCVTMHGFTLLTTVCIDKVYNVVSLKCLSQIHLQLQPWPSGSN